MKEETPVIIAESDSETHLSLNVFCNHPTTLFAIKRILIVCRIQSLNMIILTSIFLDNKSNLIMALSPQLNDTYTVTLSLVCHCNLIYAAKKLLVRWTNFWCYSIYSHKMVKSRFQYLDLFLNHSSECWNNAFTILWL